MLFASASDNALSRLYLRGNEAGGMLVRLLSPSVVIEENGHPAKMYQGVIAFSSCGTVIMRIVRACRRLVASATCLRIVVTVSNSR